jgi:streptogramin lyase
MTARLRSAVALAAFALLALPAAAGAAAITEYEIEPGRPDIHAPSSIVAAPDGNLWYADQGPARAIGRISPAGERFAAIPVPGPGTPWDLAVAPDGSVAMTTDAGVILRNPAGGTTTLESEPGYGILRLADGSLVWGSTPAAAANSTASLCLQVPGRLVTCAGGHGLGWVDDIALAADGRIWAVSSQGDVATRASTDLLSDLTIPLPVGSGAAHITAGPDGNLWATMSTADAVDRITPAGIRTRFALPAGTGPEDVAAGPDGALWITGYDSNTIVRMTTAGVVTASYPVPTPDARPSGITAGPDGAMWFTENGSGRIGRLGNDPTVANGGGSGGGPAAGGTAGAARPRFLSGPALSRRRLHAGATATLSFSLSVAADVRVAIQRAGRGRRVGGRCPRSTTRNRTRPRCTRWTTVVTLRRHGRRGANRIAVRTRGLHAARYRAILTATDTSGRTSRTARVSFTLLARRR